MNIAIMALLACNDLPEKVYDLAQAYWGGEDCGFALHDALLECGKDDLAKMFDGRLVGVKKS